MLVVLIQSDYLLVGFLYSTFSFFFFPGESSQAAHRPSARQLLTFFSSSN